MNYAGGNAKRGRARGSLQRDCGFHITAAILEVTEVARERKRKRERERESVKFARKGEVTTVAGDHLSWSAIAATERSDVGLSI